MKDSFHSDDWLAFLCWGLDLLTNPKPYKILRTYEEWYFENRLRPQIRQLERAKLVERHGSVGHVTLHLTARGRLAAWGGIDPQQRWPRTWDGRWRFLLFDLPVRSQTLRVRLWRWLRAERFGFLQRSVWLSPDPIVRASLPLQHFKMSAESVTVVEGRPAGTDSDADLVAGAWDFAAINRRYQAVLEEAARGMELAKGGPLQRGQFRQWLAAENETWRLALSEDPLLPEPLLPRDYLGCKALKARQAAHSALAQVTESR